MCYSEIIWAYKKPRVKNKGTLYLTLKDINHLDRIYKKYKILPESIKKVSIFFLLDKHKLIRYLIKELDILLEVGGTFLIMATPSQDHAKFIRSKAQICSEFTLSTDGRYINFYSSQDDDILKLNFKKCSQVLIEQDSITRWSFGIITNGKNNTQVSTSIKSILEQNIPDFEIIICGKYIGSYLEHPAVKLMADRAITADIRANICVKKNIIANEAIYNNLLIIHDRYRFPLSWYEQMCSYGNYFEILGMPNVGENKGRVSDWNFFSDSLSGTMRADYILPEYTSWSPWWYSQGGLLIVKKNLYSKYPLDNRLHWGELEDVQFSKVANLKGAFYYFDPNNHICTISNRLPESKYFNSTILKQLRYYRGVIFSYKIVITNIIKHYKNRLI